jgi:hypothetical protein
MRKIIMALSLAALVAPAAPVLADPPPWAPAHGKRAKGHGKWYADRYYRDGRHYQPRRLSYNDRIYRGRDGRYYCRRDDGTTGLIIGAAVGGLLGNRIAPGDSRTIGTIIGAGAGALLGREIDRGDVRCR